MSTPRSLRRSRLIVRTDIETPRGVFAALRAEPTRGVCEHQPALLVPGFTGSKEDFLTVLESLATAGRTVLAIDMRGQFESAPADVGEGYALAKLGADLVAVADALSVAADCGEADRVHLVGHSFGGIVAREAAIAAPGAFSSLTLLGSGPGTIGGQRAQAARELLDYVAGSHGESAPLASTAGSHRESSPLASTAGSHRESSPLGSTAPAGGDRTALAAKIGEFWQTKLRPQAQAEGTPPDIIDFLAERTLRTCPVGLIEMARHLLDCPDRTCDLAHVAQWPILVCYGENDDAWPPDIQDIMAKRLRAERICIPDAAHSPAVEAPETTSATLTTFWNQAESRR